MKFATKLLHEIPPDKITGQRPFRFIKLRLIFKIPLKILKKFLPGISRDLFTAELAIRLLQILSRELLHLKTEREQLHFLQVWRQFRRLF